MKRIINVETGEVVERELNAEELAQQKIDEAEIKAEQKLKISEQTATLSAKSDLLDRLGITEDEAKLLLS